MLTKHLNLGKKKSNKIKNKNSFCEKKKKWREKKFNELSKNSKCSKAELPNILACTATAHEEPNHLP